MANSSPITGMARADHLKGLLSEVGPQRNRRRKLAMTISMIGMYSVSQVDAVGNDSPKSGLKRGT